MICICTRLHVFASLGGVFSLFSPLNIYISLFLPLSALSLLPACCRASLRSPPPLPRREAIRAPLSCLPCLPSFRLPSAPPAPAVCLLWWLPCRLSSLLPPLCPHLARPEAIWRPSVCRSVCLLLSVTRQPSGAKQCDSVGRCSAYMSPALSPLAYVLPCVPLLVPWLPSVRLCVCPAAVCRQVVTIACTPLY